MSADMQFNGRGMSRIQVNVVPSIAKIVAALEKAQPQTKGELIKATDLLDVELNVALDRAQTDEVITRRVIAGRIVYSLADWEQPSPRRPMPAIESNSSDVKAPFESAPASETNSREAGALPLRGPHQNRVLAFLASGAALTNGDIQTELLMSACQVSGALRELHYKEFVTLKGGGRKGLWCITEAGRAAMPSSFMQPVSSHPAVQATVTRNGASGGDVPILTSHVETPPPGPREGLSLEQLASGESLLQAHAKAAEHEAAFRGHATFVDLETEGLDTVADPDKAHAIQIDSARYALWSDGRLVVDSGDVDIQFSIEATKQLVHYLDRIAEIDLSAR